MPLWDRPDSPFYTLIWLSLYELWSGGWTDAPKFSGGISEY